MQIKYRLIIKDNRVEEEQYLEGVCCNDMEKALLAQETALSKINSVLWLYCPFCKTEIQY